MASSAENLVILPSDLKSLNDMFPEKEDQTDLTPGKEIVELYSINALKIGRPLDSAVIILFGETGSGKSTTINKLFDDDQLCETSDIESATSNILTVEKILKVSETPAVQGKICFVDTPGTLDTDNKDNFNLATFRKFRKEFKGLARRKVENCNFGFQVSEKVYPNMILFMVDASDNRMGGPNSSLSKTIKAFEQTPDLIDKERHNIIVVLTHALSLGIAKETFKKKLKAKTDIIQSQFKDILGISNVVVIPVENMPGDFNLEKDGDFWRLPNDHFFYLNLFTAMQKCFAENLDWLGGLLTSHYFTNCLEKAQNAIVTKFDCEIDDNDIQMATDSLTNLSTGYNITITEVPTFSFQSMGLGFCPVTETIKLASPFQNLGSPQQAKIGNSKFLIPESVKFSTDVHSKYRRLTYLDRSEYQSHKKLQYKIDVNWKFVFQGDSSGKFFNDTNSTRESSQLVLQHELQVARFSLFNHRSIKFCKLFEKDLEQILRDNKPENYSVFFSRWGTHFIHDVLVGGALEMTCSVRKHRQKTNDLKEIDANVQILFSSMCTVGAKVDIEEKVKQLRNHGTTQEHLEFIGGEAPTLPSLGSTKPEEIQEWVRSVPKKPAELVNTIQITPYYDILPIGEDCEKLRDATKEYLEGKLEVKKGSNNRDKVGSMMLFAFLHPMGWFSYSICQYVDNPTEMSLHERMRNNKVIWSKGMGSVYDKLGSH